MSKVNTNLAPRMQKFTVDGLLVKPDSDYQAYRPRDKSVTKAVSWPARKRLLSHIQFLTLYLKPEHKICVYSGGNFHSLLGVLFPSVSFHVYDPNAQLTLTDRIQVTPSVLTPELARQYQDQNVLFISQPRIPAYAQYWSKKIAADTKRRLSHSIAARLGITLDAQNNPTGANRTQQDFQEQLRSELKQAKQQANLDHEMAVWTIVQAQQDIVRSLNPLQAWLAFRLPYPLLEEYKQVAFLSGVIHRLAWSGFESTETALLPVRVNGEYVLSMWDSTAYEGAMFFHNAQTREHGAHVNQFTDTLIPIDTPELLNDFDSSAEAFILSTYRDRFTPISGGKFVTDLSRLITTELNRGGKNKSLAGIRSRSKLGKNDPFTKPSMTVETVPAITPAIPLPEIGINGTELPDLVIHQPSQIVNGAMELIPVTAISGQSVGVVPETLEVDKIPGPSGTVIPISEEPKIGARRNPFVKTTEVLETPTVPTSVPGRSGVRPVTNPFLAPRGVQPVLSQTAVVRPVTQPRVVPIQPSQPAPVPIVRPIQPPQTAPIQPIIPIIRPIQPTQITPAQIRPPSAGIRPIQPIQPSFVPSSQVGTQ